MITLKALDGRHLKQTIIETVVTPTIFPDGTSQVWKLPEEMLVLKEFVIDWRFESERELLDVAALANLIWYRHTTNAHIRLHMPYLPYARQDKNVSNESTFQLRVFADLINALPINEVTTVDPHSAIAFEIARLKSLSVHHIHNEIICKLKPDWIVFPDKGACARYAIDPSIPVMTGEKIRDQSTGIITGLKLTANSAGGSQPNAKFLIIDDICDGGATFIEVARQLREVFSDAHITLFVTHGVFSKGRHLPGIDEVLTTNSLPKNKFSPFEV